MTPTGGQQTAEQAEIGHKLRLPLTTRVFSGRTPAAAMPHSAEHTMEGLLQSQAFLKLSFPWLPGVRPVQCILVYKISLLGGVNLIANPPPPCVFKIVV